MTTSQRSRRPSSPVWRVLGSWVRALRNLHREQVYAWECFFRSCRAPQPRTQTPGLVDDHTATTSRAPVGVTQR